MEVKFPIFNFCFEYETSKFIRKDLKKTTDKIMIFLNSQSFAINHMKRDFDVKSSIFAPNKS